MGQKGTAPPPPPKFWRGTMSKLKLPYINSNTNEALEPSPYIIMGEKSPTLAFSQCLHHLHETAELCQ